MVEFIIKKKRRRTYNKLVWFNND